MTPYAIENPNIRITGRTGYTRHADRVSLFVERIDNPDGSGLISGSLAVQLWACDAAYSGGDLTGWKLAEAPLGVLRPGECVAPFHSEAPAALPEAGDFSMTLAVTEWDGDGFNRIHDFHNYPTRDTFVHPRLEGAVEYRLSDERRLSVSIEGIHNRRQADNLSGSLVLEFWALPQAYAGGDFAGQALGAIALGTLAGGSAWRDNHYELELSQPPDGTLVLMLREWNGNAYVTRDHRNLHEPDMTPSGIATDTPQPTPPASGTDTPAGSQEDTTDEGSDSAAGVPVTASAAATAPEQPRADRPPPGSACEAASPPQTRIQRCKAVGRRLWTWIKIHW